MIISFKHKFIFMKTRKTAGSSIQAALSKICGEEDIITGSNYDLKTNILDESHTAGRNIDKFFTNHPHPLMSDVKDFLGKNTWNSFFKFAFVRNPFDVAISRYFWNVKGKNQNVEDCSVEGFRKWILTYCSDNAVFGPAEFYTNDLAHLYTCSDGGYANGIYI